MMIQWVKNSMKITIILLAVSTVLFIFNLVAFPWFRYAPFFFLAIFVVLLVISPVLEGERDRAQGANMSALKVTVIAVVTVIAIAVGAILYRFATELVFPRKRHTEFISPQGTNTVIIEYDHLSRPKIYRKVAGVFQVKTPTQVNDSGYISLLNEPRTYTVHWENENEVTVHKGNYEKGVRIKLK